MNSITHQFAAHRQSIWLDSINRNTTTFEHAIGAGNADDASIQVLDDAGLSSAASASRAARSG